MASFAVLVAISPPDMVKTPALSPSADADEVVPGLLKFVNVVAVPN